MFVNRTRGVVVATASVLSLVACSDASQNTDLRPDGPPEVLSVLVMDDAASGLIESATFCKVGDTKRPGLVGTPDGLTHQICPDDKTMGVDELADASPQNWYVRIMFDELLDPNVEELVAIVDANGNPTGTYSGTIANTKPVTLQCQSVNGNTLIDIPYDGYYSPSGNNVTWPLGPSLVIKPNSPALVATQSECQITIKKNVLDKDGIEVPDAQKGPYKFKIAPVALVTADTAPADGDMVDAIAAGVDITFNTFIDGTTLVAPVDPPDGTETYDYAPHITTQYAFDESGITGLPEYFLGGDFEVNGDYTWAIKAGAKIKDQCGRETTFTAPSKDAGTQLEFTTNPLAFNGIAPFDGQMNAKAKDNVHLKFNQYMDPSTLATTEWSLSPTAANAVASFDGATGDLIIKADYAPATDYTFTLKANATINDCPGGEIGACVTSANGGTFTNSMGDQVVHYHTAAVAITGTTPKDNGEVDKAATTDPLDVTISFNTLMMPATLATTEWSISPAVPMTLLNTTKASSFTFESDNPIPAGDYTFTLKQGATINDVVGGTYTQASDLVVHITVVEATPPSAAPACY